MVQKYQKQILKGVKNPEDQNEDLIGELER